MAPCLEACRQGPSAQLLAGMLRPQGRCFVLGFEGFSVWPVHSGLAQCLEDVQQAPVTSFRVLSPLSSLALFCDTALHISPKTMIQL